MNQPVTRSSEVKARAAVNVKFERRVVQPNDEIQALLGLSGRRIRASKSPPSRLRSWRGDGDDLETS